jgi:hypothetical protein
LFCAIFAYALFSHENVTFLREQFARHERMIVDFDLNLDESGGLCVWAANLGASSFLVSVIVVRTQERSAPRRCRVNAVVPVGQLGQCSSKIAFDDRIFRVLRSDTFVHVDVSLRCRGVAQNVQTRWRGFMVERGPHRQLEQGFTGLWGVACPKYSRFDFMGRKTEGLPDLESAWRRQGEWENDLKTSCPRHHSALLLESDKAARQLVGVS